MTTRPDLILASQSQARARILENAGIDARAVPARIDEESVKAGLMAEATVAHDIADALAELKALRVSGQYLQAYVIGCDQVLSLKGQVFNKPADMAAAREQLVALRGQTHSLISAICLARGGTVIWRHISRPRLTMRDFSDAFLDSYLAQAGEAVLTSVGAYQLEGLGSQLFSRIEGGYFSILGLPLLPLQDILRRHQVLVS